MKHKLLIATPLALVLAAALMIANGCGYFSSKNKTISYEYGMEMHGDLYET